MFLVIHAAAGATLGAQVQNPFLAFFLGLISHYLLDAIPHGDEKLRQDFEDKHRIKCTFIVGIDFVLTILTIITMVWLDAPPNPLGLASGIFGALLPDFIQLIYFLSSHPWLKKFSNLHNAFHYNNTRFNLGYIRGFLFQAIILILLFFISR